MSQYNRNGIQQLDNKKKQEKRQVDYSGINIKKQGDCIKCDGYDMTCYSFRAYKPQMVSPCVTKWNMGEPSDLEKKLK